MQAQQVHALQMHAQQFHAQKTLAQFNNVFYILQTFKLGVLLTSTCRHLSYPQMFHGAENLHSQRYAVVRGNPPIVCI